MPAFCDKDVRRFDVSVDNTSRVGGVERVCDLNPQRQYLLDFHRLTAYSVLQRQPFEILHRDERLIALLTDFVNRADVRMIEGGRGTSLSAKSFERLWGMSNVFGEEFQGDESTKVDVLGFVHRTHPAAAKFLDDAVMRYGLPNELGRCGHWTDMLGMQRRRVNEWDEMTL
jgi:hypothetical protein